jgi:hypothetical protein
MLFSFAAGYLKSQFGKLLRHPFRIKQRHVSVIHSRKAF